MCSALSNKRTNECAHSEGTTEFTWVEVMNGEDEVKHACDDNLGKMSKW